MHNILSSVEYELSNMSFVLDVPIVSNLFPLLLIVTAECKVPTRYKTVWEKESIWNKTQELADRVLVEKDQFGQIKDTQYPRN